MQCLDIAWKPSRGHARWTLVPGMGAKSCIQDDVQGGCYKLFPRLGLLWSGPIPCFRPTRSIDRTPSPTSISHSCIPLHVSTIFSRRLPILHTQMPAADTDTFSPSLAAPSQPVPHSNVVVGGNARHWALYSLRPPESAASTVRGVMPLPYPTVALADNLSHFR
uniref:Uncharacterized protein n=1 Tax=Mycena chlorophos TaxID=658473 RepID=A0ABQ0LFH5_MYCCL|nr:predicted protein [Mycena chlorophos]